MANMLAEHAPDLWAWAARFLDAATGSSGSLTGTRSAQAPAKPASKGALGIDAGFRRNWTALSAPSWPNAGRAARSGSAGRDR